ncbi:MAG: hypothetical protein M3P18_10165, partial [Actinomycetota bacterium]|nr:hypothetical protein [Actinomycetota bacterium]
GEGSITTNWAASDVLKGTELVLADGTSFTMNHVNGTVACVDRSGSELIYEADRDSPLPRLRYRRMLDAYLRDDCDVFGEALTLRLHELLAEGFGKNESDCGHGFSLD